MQRLIGVIRLIWKVGRFRGAKSFDDAKISLLRNRVATCSFSLVHGSMKFAQLRK